MRQSGPNRGRRWDLGSESGIVIKSKSIDRICLEGSVETTSRRCWRAHGGCTWEWTWEWTWERTWGAYVGAYMGSVTPSANERDGHGHQTPPVITCSCLHPPASQAAA